MQNLFGLGSLGIGPQQQGATGPQAAPIDYDRIRSILNSGALRQGGAQMPAMQPAPLMTPPEPPKDGGFDLMKLIGSMFGGMG